MYCSKSSYVCPYHPQGRQKIEDSGFELVDHPVCWQLLVLALTLREDVKRRRDLLPIRLPATQRPIDGTL